MKWRVANAAMLLAAVLSLTSFVAAQDRDADDVYNRPGNYGQARQYGYQNGYNNGVEKGRHEGRENDPSDYRTPDWQAATIGYQPWMGPLNVYQQSYREGYASGFSAGFQAARPGSYGSPYYGGGAVAARPLPYPNEGAYPVYGNGQYYPAGYQGPAYSTGYQDGANQAREDLAKRKPFDSTPRGPYDDRDHGYNRSYGSKDAYKAAYTNGYRAGYETAFRRY